MPFQIAVLSKDDVGGFYSVFATAMKTLFTCYSPKIIDFFINKVYTPNNFFYWINNNYKTVIVGKSRDNLAGFIILDQPYGGVSMCRWLGVLKPYQKLGLGKQLVKAWEEHARSLGCHKIELAAQPLAKTFYEKCGLVLEGKRQLSYFGQEQYIFGKVIGEPQEDTMTKYF